MLQVLVNVFLEIFQLQKEICGYAKKYRKNGKVSKYLKQWVLRCLLKKEKKRDSPYSLAKDFKC
jgi:hypothetical protein